MSNFRNSARLYRDLHTPSRNATFASVVRRGDTSWIWVAAALSLAFVVAVAFGIGHRPGASNDQTPTAVSTLTSPTIDRR
jgi:hypothetical protein